MHKIYIVGNIGSGKSFFAKKLSSAINIKWYELDMIIHVDTINDNHRPLIEQKELLNKILDEENWIIEGIYRSICKDVIVQANAILFLDTPIWKCVFRVIIRQFSLMLKNKNKFKLRVKLLFDLLFYIYNFKLNQGQLLQILHPHNEKVIFINDIYKNLSINCLLKKLHSLSK